MMALQHLAARMAAAQRMRRIGLALFLGLLGAGAMPPFNLVPLLVPSLVGLLWQLDGAATGRRAFGTGWYWGMGFFVPSLYWISLSLLTDPLHLIWLLPFTLLGLPAFLSLWGAAATWLLWRSHARGLARILLFTLLWSIAEWLRGHVPLGGFPWALIGHAWSGSSSILLDMAQSVSVFGIYGLSLLTVLAASLPTLLGEAGSGRVKAGSVAVSVLLVVVGIAWGANRLDAGLDPDVPGVLIRIVQTDVPNTKAANGRDAAVDRLRKVLAIAHSPGADAVAAQLWPESSVDMVLTRPAGLTQIVGQAASDHGFVLTGTALAEGDQYFNSVAAVDHTGELVAAYHKAHLVPFGEYVPFQQWLSFIPTIAENTGWTLGPGPTTLDLPGLPPVSPIVCYEAIFPHAVIDPAHRPGWLLNVTNDAWFGDSTGPYQHFALARLRTIEQGLPMLRAANGGISGVVDAYGRLIEAMPLGQSGFLDVKLPQALAGDTLYGRFGDLALVPLLLMLIAALAVVRYSSGAIRTE